MLVFSYVTDGVQGGNITRLLSLVGPCPRLLMLNRFDLLDDILEEYTDLADTLICHLDAVMKAIMGAPNPVRDQYDGFHRFFYLTGPVSNGSLQRFGFRPLHAVGSPWLFRILRRAVYCKYTQGLDSLLASVAGNTTMFCIVFEAYLLRRIREGLLPDRYHLLNRPEATYRLMGSDTTGDPSSHLCTDVYLGMDGPIPIVTQAAQYFITLTPNFPTVDGVLVTSSHVLVLQIVVANRHRLLSSGLERVHKLVKDNGLLQGRQWRLIFITPQAANGERLAESTPARSLVKWDLKNLSLELDIGIMTIPVQNGVRALLQLALHTSLISSARCSGILIKHPFCKTGTVTHLTTWL